jgi:leucyl aminopeptidase
MKIECIQKNIIEAECDALVVNLFEGVTDPAGATGAVNEALAGMITEVITNGEMTGKINETAIIHTRGMIPAKRVIVVGLGKSKDFSLDRVRQAAGTSVRAAKKAKARKVVSIIHGAGIGGLLPDDAARCVVEGAALAAYSFRAYKTDEDNDFNVEQFAIAELDQDKFDRCKDGANKGLILSEMTNIARNLVSTPANHMTPNILSEKALALAKEYGVVCEVMDRAALEEMGLNALLGVGKGSAEEPKMVVMKYQGAGAASDLTALVGKGMTFDSGGISLKPADGMQMMKDDMGGAAAVICAITAIARLQLKVNVLAVAPLAENMPSGTAQKPGDVVRSYSGKTIEILNTDAEGRLILADAVYFAKEKGAARIIDVATLTGSVVVALGHEASGYISNNDAFSQTLEEAAAISGEKCWRLPIFDEYKEYLKSDIADLKNIGGRPAGAITGGMFIGSAIDDMPWIHLDIAGTVWTDKDLPYIGKGATGVAVRTLTHLAELYQI